MGRYGPVHPVVNCRRATALDAASQTSTEVSLTMDVVHLARITMYDEVASCEGAVLDTFVFDLKLDLVVAERASEITTAVECRESPRLAVICYRMHDISLYGQCSASHVAGEAESLMHFDNRCVVAQNSGTRDRRPLRERNRARSSIQVVIMVGMGRGCRGHSYGR